MPHLPESVLDLLWFCLIVMGGVVTTVVGFAIKRINAELRDMKERLVLSAKRNEEQGRQITELATQLAANNATTNELVRTMNGVVADNSDAFRENSTVLREAIDVIRDTKAALRSMAPDGHSGALSEAK